MQENQNQDSTVVKLQSDQFIIGSIGHTTMIAGEGKQYEVDLARQNCQCKDFKKYRNSFPIGDPRRFCRHLVAARCEHLDDLSPFLQSLFEVHESAQAGLPNGASFAFFEIDGRLGFYCENRDQTAYFFLTGVGGSVFYEFVYDRKRKKWLNGKSPDSPEKLLVFAFKERGKFVTPKKSLAEIRRIRRRRRSQPSQPRETSAPVKYLFLLLVTAGLAGAGYLMFKGPVERWLAAADREEKEEPAPPPENKIPEHEKKRGAFDQMIADLEGVEIVDPADLQQPGTVDDTPENSDTPGEPGGNDENNEPATEIAEPEFREWKTANEKFSAIAKYRYYQNGFVVIERQDNGQTIKIEVGMLRTEDQEYVKKIRLERRLQNARARRNQNRNDNSTDN